MTDHAKHSLMPCLGVHNSGPQNGAFGEQLPYHKLHRQGIRYEIGGAGVRRKDREAHELQ